MSNVLDGINASRLLPEEAAANARYLAAIDLDHLPHPDAIAPATGKKAKSAAGSVLATRQASVPAIPIVAGLTQTDIDRAVVRGVAQGVSQERARVAKVFGLAASHGRERICAELLTSDTGYSAERFARDLAHMPTDRERAAQHVADSRQAKAQAIVVAQRGPDPVTPGTSAKRIIDAQRATGSVFVKPAVTPDAAAEAPKSKAAQIVAAQRAMGSLFVRN